MDPDDTMQIADAASAISSIPEAPNYRSPALQGVHESKREVVTKKASEFIDMLLRNEVTSVASALLGLTEHDHPLSSLLNLETRSRHRIS